MTLPNGWRTRISRLVLPLLAVLAPLVYAIFVHMWLLSWQVDERAVVTYLVVEGCAAGVVAMYIVWISYHVRDTAHLVHTLGIEDTTLTVAAFLEGRGIVHARPPYRKRGFELEGGRVLIEVVAFDPVLTWVLVSPVPAGEDPRFNELLAGLKGAFDEQRRPNSAR